MSKHVWRGKSTKYHAWREVVETFGYLENCTVIEDAACFPVRDAMRLCKVSDACTTMGALASLAVSPMANKYRKAVARMKARNGKRT